MADNFLEQRMEDLLSGKIAASLRRPGGSSQRKHVHFYVTIIGGLCDEGIAKASELLKKGGKVDIIDSDWKKGSLLAQRHGFKFHPVDMADGKAIVLRIEEIRKERGLISEIIDLRKP